MYYSNILYGMIIRITVTKLINMYATTTNKIFLYILYKQLNQKNFSCNICQAIIALNKILTKLWSIIV